MTLTSSQSPKNSFTYSYVIFTCPGVPSFGTRIMSRHHTYVWMTRSGPNSGRKRTFSNLEAPQEEATTIAGSMAQPGGGHQMVLRISWAIMVLLEEPPDLKILVLGRYMYLGAE